MHSRLQAMGICATVALFSIYCGSLVQELDRIRKKAESGTENCSLSVNPVKPLYADAPGWLDYVRNDGPSPLDASGIACDGTEGGHYGSCVHGGETRIARIDCLASCSGVSVSDALGAFQWSCIERSGKVLAVSSGLMLEKNLSDLIDFAAGSWLPNSITVNTPAGSTSSPASVWWQNAIVRNAAPATLSATGKIYVFDANPNGNFTLATDSIAFVGKPRVFLNGSASYLAASGRKFLWVEGDFRLFTDSDLAVDFTAVKNSMLRNIAVSGTGSAMPTYGSAIRLSGASGNFLLNFRGSGFGNYGIILDNAPYNTLNRVSRSNGYMRLLDFPGGTAHNNIILDHLGSSVVYGVINLTPGNAGGYFQNGFNLSSQETTLQFEGGRSTILSQVVANVSSATHKGLVLNYATTVDSVIADVAFAHGQIGVDAMYNNSHHFFTGELLVGNNAANDCLGSVGRGILTGCASDGASDFSLTTGVSLVGTFVGRLFVNDAANTSTASGGLSTGSPTDWLYFENRYRAWGKTLADIGVSGNAGYCSGSCRLWDFSLRASDSVLRNRLTLPAASDTLIHRWEEASLSTCKKIKDAVWQDQVCDRPGYTTAATCTLAGGVWSTNLCSTRFLRHAHEIFFDGAGNDNGLCESNERCVYTPNIGAYQGHGNLVYVGRISGGTGEIQGVELFRHESNGY